MAPKATIDSATASDNFSVLLRYADATGEKVRIVILTAQVPALHGHLHDTSSRLIDDFA